MFQKTLRILKYLWLWSCLSNDPRPLARPAPGSETVVSASEEVSPALEEEDSSDFFAASRAIKRPRPLPLPGWSAIFSFRLLSSILQFDWLDTKLRKQLYWEELKLKIQRCLIFCQFWTKINGKRQIYCNSRAEKFGKNCTDIERFRDL